jgi:hypothetical protein
MYVSVQTQAEQRREALAVIGRTAGLRAIRARLMMGTTSTTSPARDRRVCGEIIEAEVKVSVDATRPLPLACALYAIATAEGVWLCAYYGANRGVFDYLPPKGAEVDEAKLGIAFHSKQFVPKDQYQPALWEEFKHLRFMAYEGH